MEPKRFTSLKNAIDQARKQLEPFRTHLAEVLRKYAGPHYGNNSVEDRPINMLQLSIDSLLQQLSSRAPQVLCRTSKADRKSAAVELELAMNEALKQMDFETEHRTWVLSAIHLMGILEVGLDVVDLPVIDDEELPITEVFVEAIMFDDFVCDTAGTGLDRRRCAFWGHKTAMSLKDCKKNPLFDKEARESLKSTSKRENSEESVDISQTNSEQGETFNETVEIWQIFVPQENEVVTFAKDSQKPLRTVKWQGPAHGPYHFLGFNLLLNNQMPVAPVMNWLDLDDLLNKLYVKCGEQASNQKSLLVTDVGSTKDGETIIAANDGDVVAVNNPGAAKDYTFGGVNQQTMGFALNVKSQSDFAMGNLSGAMGLGASADTLGQEQMIKQASDVRMTAMQGVIMSATQKVLKDIAFYLWQHPTVELNLTRKIQGTNIELEFSWPRRLDGFGNEFDSRKGSHDDFGISIVPYSMRELPPSTRAELLRDIWKTEILPLVSMGVMPDAVMYLTTLATLYDLPELRELIPATQAAMPQQATMGQGGMQMPKPGKPNGNYTRNNVSSGMTPQALDQQREMFAMAGGGQ